MEKYKILFEENEVLKLVKEALGTLFNQEYLVGGAVVDIIEGRTPKDYDFIGFETRANKLYEAGFNFVGETKTAKTFEKDGHTIQILKTDKDDFDFTISQSTVNLKSLVVIVDMMSLENKILIPPRNSFHNKQNALNSLRRIVHWKQKGYSIPDSTYLSLLGVLNKSENVNS